MRALAIRPIVALAFAFPFGCATTPTGTPVTPAAPEPAAATAPAPAPPPPGRGGAVVPTAPSEPPVRTLASATVGAVGDVLMHEAVKRSAEFHGAGSPDGGYAWLFAPIADLLSAPDLTFANLETPIAPEAGQGTRPYVFNAPPAVLGALASAGVDLVSFANNHAFDQGRPGFEETLRRIERAGLRYVGAGPAGRAAGPVLLEAGGLRLAFLGYAHFFNQDGNACPPARAGGCVQASELDRRKAVEDVRAAAAGADAVIVSLHWGDEYELQPREADVELAHRLADAGALVVLGHHPHVLQPVELYRRADGRTAVIAYSLGNFISNQSRNYVPGVTPDSIAATRDGALLRVSLAKRDYGRGVVEVEVAGADFVALWTENDTPEIDRKREPSRRPAIRVVAVDRALARARAELARFPADVPPERRAEWVRLRQREALLAARKAAAASVLGEDLARTLLPAELEVAGAPAAGATPTVAR